MKTYLRSVAGMIIILSAAVGVPAQITITLPKIPKITKPKPEQPKQEQPKQEQPRQETPQVGIQDDRQQTSDKTTSTQTHDCANDSIMRVFLDDIEKVRKEAEEFRPGLRDYYVSTRSDRKNLYMEAALSTKLRNDWFSEWKENSYQLKQCLSPALDNLALTARKTLPTFLGPSGYTLGTPAEKKVLLSAVTDITSGKVLKVGIKQANWMIEKDSYNFPTARYKHGMVYAQYPNDVVGYCWVFWVNIVQDYAGGGTYGASYGNFISRAVAGCPAEK